ncbi:FAD/NAD(P)-binding protein [Pedobacter insulae]|uniref:FAD-NAD(P)-binding n=1 Tax=Pedobacter insulae TaxID=414048 RepID=A0A1I3AEU1_9SPHI|nr:FAD/NAD(P)-binding protein [Pedobacter insulae]SFH48538.1 FAD-NAD(P)-binding [Pedobacter insulae]
MPKKKQKTKRVAILGGGPSGLFLFKRLLDCGNREIEITIIEKRDRLGAGMPYSSCGANDEHITNVSENEIPELVTSITEWVKTVSPAILKQYAIDPANFNEYKVLPRLFFGMYLSAQFELLLTCAKEKGVVTHLCLECHVEDIVDHPDLKETWVIISGREPLKFDAVIICTGHHWPKKHEGKLPGYFESPYPPSKLNLLLNHLVAVKGSSLTAIDAIRTLARNNGKFISNESKRLSYQPFKHCQNFKISMHSRNGMLPAVRFHLEDPRLHNDELLNNGEIVAHIKRNNGFLSLDYIFEKDFKEIFKEKDPSFYEKIKEMSLEEFVSAMMELREELDPFQLLKAEYEQAAKSIKRQESIYWKEMLGILSFTLNYPAKYLSAEDMLRLQNTLMPLISIVIAYVPQSSCEELMALHQAGVLDMIAVGDDSRVEPAAQQGGAIYHFTDDTGERQSKHYQTYIDCTGQPHLSLSEFPFKSMLADKTISPARIRFQSEERGRIAFEKGDEKVEMGEDGTYYLQVSGISINDSFQVLDRYGAYNKRIYMMAVPYMDGLNPDYSGLDFCEEASKRIVETLISDLRSRPI